jgi:hypothetical protein
MNSDPKNSISQRKLVSSCLGGSAIAAATSLTGTAEASVVWFDVQDVSLTPMQWVYVDIDAGLSYDPVPSGTVSPFGAEYRLFFNGGDTPEIRETKPGVASAVENPDLNFVANKLPGPFLGGAGSSFALKITPGTDVQALPFNPAGPEGRATAYLSYDNDPTAEWQADGTDGFLGLRFQLNGLNHYGWAKVSFNDGGLGDNSFTIKEFAYNDIADETIAAGQIPEPHSVLLLAMGSAGLSLLRRRQ